MYSDYVKALFKMPLTPEQIEDYNYVHNRAEIDFANGKPQEYFEHVIITAVAKEDYIFAAAVKAVVDVNFGEAGNIEDELNNRPNN